MNKVIDLRSALELLRNTPVSCPLYSSSNRDVGISCKAIFNCTVPFDMKERFTRASFMEVDYKKWLKD